MSLCAGMSSPRLASHRLTWLQRRTMKMPMPCDLLVGFMIHIEPTRVHTSGLNRFPPLVAVRFAHEAWRALELLGQKREVPRQDEGGGDAVEVALSRAWCATLALLGKHLLQLAAVALEILHHQVLGVVRERR